jgi:putative peptide zinc metalloprotease protein
VLAPVDEPTAAGAPVAGVMVAPEAAVAALERDEVGHADDPVVVVPTDPPPATPAPADAPHAVDDPPAVEAEAPRLADGVELIGRFEDSGFKEPPYIARRSDGQVVQLPELLFRLAEQVDGRSGMDELARRFSDRVERQVQPADVAMLVDQQLRPLGIVAQPGDASVELNKVDPLLALKFRAAVIPEGAVRGVTTLFRPLFLAPVVALVVAGLLGVDAWLFLVHGVSQSLRHVMYQPLLMLMLIGGVIVATAFHEVGHATAVRYGGAKPGVMGVGIYLVWPAFYTDITDAYRLDKRGRLRTDLGGVYFNAIFALIAMGAYAATRWEPLLLLILLQNFAILQQSLPFLRLDGYYVLSDLTGVPDIFLRIRPVLASFLPGREPDPRVTELKSWVRLVVSAYVVAVIAFLGLTIVMLTINLPRMVSTGYDSVALHYDAVGPAFRAGQAASGVVDIVEMIFLILPAAGLGLTLARVARRSSTGALRWSAGHPGRRALLTAGGAAAVALAAFSWWPNGEYRPIQPAERGTLEGAVSQVAALPTGRPSLTARRQAQLGGAPTERQRRRAAVTSTVTQRSGASGASTDTTSGQGSTTPPAPGADTSTTTTTTTATQPVPADTAAAPAPPATSAQPATTQPATTPAQTTTTPSTTTTTSTSTQPSSTTTTTTSTTAPTTSSGSATP